MIYSSRQESEDSLEWLGTVKAGTQTADSLQASQCFHLDFYQAKFTEIKLLGLMCVQLWATCENKDAIKGSVSKILNSLLSSEAYPYKGIFLFALNLFIY